MALPLSRIAAQLYPQDKPDRPHAELPATAIARIATLHNEVRVAFRLQVHPLRGFPDN